MISRFRLFGATLQYSFLGWLPAYRKRFLEYLSKVSEEDVIDLCSQEVLEVWAEQFGTGGLILGSIAMFLFGILLMVAADIIIARISNEMGSLFANGFAGLFCLEKYRYSRTKVVLNLLVVAYVGVTFYSGFYWTISALFLSLLVIENAYVEKGRDTL